MSASPCDWSKLSMDNGKQLTPLQESNYPASQQFRWDKEAEFFNLLIEPSFLTQAG